MHARCCGTAVFPALKSYNSLWIFVLILSGSAASAAPAAAVILLQQQLDHIHSHTDDDVVTAAVL